MVSYNHSTYPSSNPTVPYPLQKSIYDDANCYRTTGIVDHTVLVVGYHYDANATETSYWVIRNSWGPGWGREGYMNISMFAGGAEGICGITSLRGMYPVISCEHTYSHTHALTLMHCPRLLVLSILTQTAMLYPRLLAVSTYTQTHSQTHYPLSLSLHPYLFFQI